MKKRIGLISALACLATVCLVTGCRESNELEQYQQQGYIISVTYDANGGSFTGRTGVSVMDLFNPSKKKADENGQVHIQLTEPTDPSRKAAGSAITLTMPEHFFAGWYHTRNVVKNEAGKPVDAEGKELEEKDGAYYYADTKKAGTPAYTYEGYWDFEKDLLYSASKGTLDWEFDEDLVYEKEDGTYALTLYAGWVPNYTFEYYYQNPEDEAEWTYLDSTSFNYKATNEEGSKTHDWDTIWLPSWGENGAMNHTFAYENEQLYEFPKIDGYTFSKAYTDPECTQEITGAFTHAGSLDLAHAKSINPVQKIYIVAEKGERYKISKAEDLSANANLAGIYEISADLDFQNGKIKWPAVFTTGTFSGKMYSATGNVFKIQNVTAEFASTGASAGGIFGRIAQTASFENLIFENTTLNFNGALSSKTEDEEAYYGLFAGFVEDGVTVTNVSIGGTIRIGKVVDWQQSYALSLTANGNATGIVKTAIKVSVCGEWMYDDVIDDVEVSCYEYTVDVDSVQVENGFVTFSVVSEFTEKTEAEILIGEY